ncbi:MAG TPA: electron transfer flavoprotein subunit alpha/FixB family protein [Syntrophomonas sp.]|jgi:electron transfer flavoprotein alpha subunit|nr:electron transfer flavoprotein subunit alpha/FixB family protein [Syntrophomonas sp.]
MAGVLIFSENRGLALELLTAANSLNATAVSACVINNDEQAQALASAGVKVYIVKNNDLVMADVGAVAGAVKQVADKAGADMVLLASNRRGKELAGRLAQAMNAGCLTDVAALSIEGDKILCQRNALGGATVATQHIDAAKKVIAIRPRTFEAAASAGAGTVEEVAVEVKKAGVTVLEFKSRAGDSVDIEAAEVLVIVGQGLNSQDDLPAVEDLAKKLNGEVACSKPVATDKKWLSEERIIGLSGKKCKPQLAVLLGISGQVQFTVGIRDAKNIVAVNSDENASINQMADYIITADLHDVVAEMNQKLG